MIPPISCSVQKRRRLNIHNSVCSASGLNYRFNINHVAPFLLWWKTAGRLGGGLRQPPRLCALGTFSAASTEVPPPSTSNVLLAKCSEIGAKRGEQVKRQTAAASEGGRCEDAAAAQLLIQSRKFCLEPAAPLDQSH